MDFQLFPKNENYHDSDFFFINFTRNFDPFYTPYGDDSWSTINDHYVSFYTRMTSHLSGYSSGTIHNRYDVLFNQFHMKEVSI